MREWLAACPWWSVLAVDAACAAGSAAWAWKETRRLDAAPAGSLDSLAELRRADEAAAVSTLALSAGYLLLPNPWPGTVYSIGLWLAAVGAVAAACVPVRRRAAGMEETDADLIRALATDLVVTAGLWASVVLSIVLFSWAGFAAVTRHLLTPHWATLLVVAGVCACYGAAQLLHAAWGPWLIVGGSREGKVAEGVLLDMAEAAFRRAGLPAPDVFLVDGRFEGGHIVGYCGLPRGPVKPILLVEERLLSRATVRELSAVLRHEASHAARNHLAGTFLWRWLTLALPAAAAWLAGAAAARYAPGFEFVAPLPAFLAAFLAVALYSTRLSRRQEMDADADAVLLYGAEPEAMLDGVALIDGLNGALQKPKFWESRTHPHLSERAAELRRRVALSARESGFRAAPSNRRARR